MPATKRPLRDWIPALMPSCASTICGTFMPASLFRSGMDPKVLADRLGHTHASFTLDVYTHLFEDQRERGAVSIQSLLSPPRDGLAQEN